MRERAPRGFALVEPQREFLSGGDVITASDGSSPQIEHVARVEVAVVRDAHASVGGTELVRAEARGAELLDRELLVREKALRIAVNDERVTGTELGSSRGPRSYSIAKW